MKLARGVDDRFWTLFGDAFTVYGGCKINLARAHEHAADRRDPRSCRRRTRTIRCSSIQRKLFMLAGYVAKAREFGETFIKTLEDFIDVREGSERAP